MGAQNGLRSVSTLNKDMSRSRLTFTQCNPDFVVPEQELKRVVEGSQHGGHSRVALRAIPCDTSSQKRPSGMRVIWLISRECDDMPLEHVDESQRTGRERNASCVEKERLDHT